MLRADVAERYLVPLSDRASIIYIGLPLDEIEDAIERSAARQSARGLLVRKHRFSFAAAIVLGQRTIPGDVTSFHFLFALSSIMEISHQLGIW
jgi:hypothetical protein